METKTRLDLALAARGQAPSRSDARAAIEAGCVKVNGVVVRKPAALVGEADTIETERPHPWVGRGGVKLAGALQAFGLDPAGCICLDIGASTGGFTDVLVSYGAQRVYAVDVGRGQLHPRLAADPRVICLEGRDMRSITQGDIPEAVEFVVADVSFIGLAKALMGLSNLCVSGARLIALVKPQFEVGPKRVGKGGLVRDPGVRLEALAQVERDLYDLGWMVQERMDSPIVGGDGNREFLIWAKRSV